MNLNENNVKNRGKGMSIGIIGLGKLGCSLAIGLKKEGFTISGLCSKSINSLQFANEILGTNFENNLFDTVKNSSIVFITVSDSAISSVASETSYNLGNEDIKDKVFIHCSGALSTSVLEPLAYKGGHIASLHPIQTFADKEMGWKGLYSIYYGFEGSNYAYESIKPIIISFKGKILNIEKKDKPIYHAAACIVSNYLVTLAYIGGYLFETLGLEFDEGVEALKPLMDKTKSNIDSLGAINALTGPISRGDAETVENHIKAIQEKAPKILNAYKALGKITIEIGLENGTINIEDAERLNKLLQ